MKFALIIAQLIVSLSLIIVILIQSEGTGLSTVFGGSGSFYRSKRGIEKLFVTITVILAILFLILSLLQIIVGQ